MFKSSPTASQDLPDPIGRACREINAFIDKLVHAGEKIDQYKRSIGQHIAAIKKARPDDWENIVLAECNLSRRSAYTYMRIADGTETVEEQRAKNRERVARHRALRNAQVTNSDITARELEAKQAHIDELEAARAHNKDLAERLRLAESKIVGLESENVELRAENAALKTELEQRGRAPVGEAVHSDLWTSFDAIAWWPNASSRARCDFIGGIGLTAVLEAMPPQWLPILERRVLGQVEQRRRREEAQAATPLKSVAIANNGLDIPTFLDRRVTAAPCAA